MVILWGCRLYSSGLARVRHPSFEATRRSPVIPPRYPSDLLSSRCTPGVEMLKDVGEYDRNKDAVRRL